MYLSTNGSTDINLGTNNKTYQVGKFSMWVPVIHCQEKAIRLIIFLSGKGKKGLHVSRVGRSVYISFFWSFSGPLVCVLVVYKGILKVQKVVDFRCR